MPAPDTCCVLDAPLDEAEAAALVSGLKALADPVRLRIISMLATSPTHEVCACVFPEALGRAQPTISHHLGLLTKAGLITRQQRGKWAWFRLVPDRLEDIRRSLGEGTEPLVAKPTVLMLCVHNAGRSQMAAGFLRHRAGDQIEVLSAGSAPGDSLNPTAVEAMAEVGIDITDQQPQRWTDEMARRADVVVSMGCGDECPVVPGTRVLDWDLADPAGQDLAFTRAVRDDISDRVDGLIAELTPTCCP